MAILDNNDDCNNDKNRLGNYYGITSLATHKIFSYRSSVIGAIILLFEIIIVSFWVSVNITGGILLLPVMLLWLGVLLLFWTGVTWVFSTAERTKTILGATIWHTSATLPLWILFNWLTFHGQFYINKGLGGAGFNFSGWILATIVSGMAILGLMKLGRQIKR